MEIKCLLSGPVSAAANRLAHSYGVSAVITLVG